MGCWFGPTQGHVSSLISPHCDPSLLGSALPKQYSQMRHRTTFNWLSRYLIRLCHIALND